MLIGSLLKNKHFRAFPSQSIFQYHTSKYYSGPKKDLYGKRKKKLN